MTANCCSTCRHWEESGGESGYLVGICHRYPPGFTGHAPDEWEEPFSWNQPTTWEVTTCGEWAARDERPHLEPAADAVRLMPDTPTFYDH
jgi:hypothetical protein